MQAPKNDTARCPLTSHFPRWMLIALLIAGCGGTEPIVSYQAPKDDFGPRAANSQSSAALTPVAQVGQETPSREGKVAEPARMLVALVTFEDKVWFFKLTGDRGKVADHVEAFNTFVRSLEFEDAKPKWALPKGWSAKSESGMRFATINVGQPRLDVSVISLPAPQDVLSNVNRWRRQLKLAPLNKGELDDNVESIELSNSKAILVDLEGELDDAAMPAAPFMRPPPEDAEANNPATNPNANQNPALNPNASGNMSGRRGGSVVAGGGNPNLATSDKVENETGDDGDEPDFSAFQPGFTFALPDGWKPGRPGMMRKLAMDVGDGKAELTVTTLGTGGAELLPNVNRWRAQLGLPPVSERAIRRSISKLTIDGQVANYISLRGKSAGADKPAMAMLVAVVPRGKLTWFFKLMGEDDVVQSERKNFETFAKSVKFTQPAD